MIKLPVEVLVTSGVPASRAAQQATNRIPIVFIAVGDPVAGRFVKDLARPEANLTGITILDTTGIGPRRLQLLQECVPSITRVAWLQSAASHASSSRCVTRSLPQR